MKAKKDNNNYIFPDIFGKWMGKLDQRTQYEGGMMSTSLIMIGLILMTTYIWLYMDMGLGFKIIATFNAIAGLLLMTSNLVTLFQQYQAFMGFQETKKLMSNDNLPEMSKEDREELEKYLTKEEITKVLKLESNTKNNERGLN